MATRRTRSADRGATAAGGSHEDMVGRLAQAIEAMANPGRRDAFKAPQFDGTGDVNYFIQQFIDVADANGWQPAAAVLHLREALRQEARDCGKANDVAGIFELLRSRFGLTNREARARITSLRRDHQTSLQAHAAEVDRLVKVAYADLPGRHQSGLVLDTFCSTLGHSYLQRHLLAVQPQTIEEAVRAGNEFLQVPTASSRSSVRTVEDCEPQPGKEGNPEGQVARVNTGMEAVLEALAKLTSEIKQLKQPATKSMTDQNQGSRPKHNRCFSCNEEGHFRRNCPTLTKKSVGESGNSQGPQQ